MNNQIADAKPGRFGSAVLNSYTWPILWTLQGVAFYLARDSQYVSFFYGAFGVESTTSLYVVLILSLLVTSAPVSAAGIEYHRATGRYFTDDRIGFAKAGCQDLGQWSGFVAFWSIAVLAGFFAPRVMGWARSVVILLVAVLLGCWVASALSRRVLGVVLHGTSQRR